ncbi:MAG: elongation factor P maturation arginine rhamnosyltransferase EarP [Sideroxydans sp.]|nr:elongation factor P maturation arginine rhamnosyltransferase EarP [Sideroxydans sp.]
MASPKSCDIFCTVVDNYGDIGVCWRLARQLANEHGLKVRLWVDDLRSFGKLCPELDVGLEGQLRHGAAEPSGAGATAMPPLPQSAGFASNVSGGQICRGVEIHHWGSVFAAIEPADLVIGAFACVLPPAYVAAMAAREIKPVWINLEYLSAEDWVETHHGLPSPHPTLPLTKYFFFPGFTEKTGGLLLERGLLDRRDAFQSDATAQAEYWQGLGVPPRIEGELRVSLFGYENEAMGALLAEWEHGSQLVTCLLPEGRALPQVLAYFNDVGRASARQVGLKPDLQVYARGNLRVHVLPFVEQEQYDLLLWACDVNFVRGEDSCVRAQWAAKPFIWHIYPQHDGVHLEKLEALRLLYTAGLPEETAQVVQAMWLSWNGGQGVATAWRDFAAQRRVLAKHGMEWAQRLSKNSLALNLLDFLRRTD